ncbi:tumor necrosis factor receptor superfamily member 1B-like [Ptychodera flava]|uniref:tumor necrosis factor receptor superfamily member 1B-like n=1 Tax=Ptychodera flava TaxID=63121 RepID=UPI00396A0102
MFASSGLSKQQKMKTALVGILTALLLAFAGQSSAAPTDTNCQSVCPAGYHIDPDSSVTSPCQDGEIPCTPCEDHTFVDVPNTGYSCFPHYICRSFEIEIEKGTRSTNTKCVCKQNLYKSMGGDCLPWTKCKKGYGVVRQGSSEVNVQCQECVNGTFSDTENSFSQCRNHTRCEDDFEVETPGSKESDTKCIRISEINPSANLPTTPSANPTSFVTKETSNPSLSSFRNSTHKITTANIPTPEPHSGNANIWMGIGIGGMMVAVIIILAIVIHK